jgi:hypothetical protein
MSRLLDSGFRRNDNVERKPVIPANPPEADKSRNPERNSWMTNNESDSLDALLFKIGNLVY